MRVIWLDILVDARVVNERLYTARPKTKTLYANKPDFVKVRTKDVHLNA